MIFLWLIFLTLFTCFPVAHYFFMRRYSERPWNIKRESYLPFVTIVVPAYNEENIIQFKLENLAKIDYPRGKFEILVVNDGSTDGTFKKILKFKKAAKDMKIEVINNPLRKGKTYGLNQALKKAKGEVLVISDADCFWPSDILQKAISYLSDPSVGAVTALEKLLNPEESWVTKTESFYNGIVHTIRLGESKIYSTYFFQGGFGAYKKAVLSQFDPYADDSGTALNMIQDGFRTLLIPEAVYYTCSPKVWKEKIIVKIRRARQLALIHWKCIKLLLKGKLKLPKKIFVPEAFMYLINPIIFFLLLISSYLIIFEIPYFLLFSLVLFVIIILNGKLRTIFLEVVQDQLILLWAIFSLITRKKFLSWKIATSSRSSINQEVLKKRGLI